MPNYSFENLETGEIKDFFYSMKEVPKVGTEIESDGGKWKRIFTIPQANIDTQIDAFSSTQFVDKTYNKKGETLGSMWDRSKELSEKRAALAGGEDPVKKKYLDDYAKKRKGVRHFAERKEQSDKVKKQASDALKKIGISIK